MTEVLTLHDQLSAARGAARGLQYADRDGTLMRMAAGLLRDREQVLDANAHDVTDAKADGMAQPQVDRLTLDEARLESIATACEAVADLPDPLGRVLDGWTLRSGPRVRKVSVPFGVIGMIYESRPNVTVDAAALALKAGSAVVLRGSTSASRSNRALVASLRRSLADAGLPPDAVQLVSDPSRDAVTALLKANGLVDLVIPRGGAGLIRHVVENATVPVIETGVGNCHVYVDAGADHDMATGIVLNAKLQRPGVCNAMEKLLVHEGEAPALLPGLVGRLRGAGVEVVGCERARALVGDVGPATEADWDTEFLALKLAVRVVDDLGDALDHIARHGTGHSEAIVTPSVLSAERFRQEVDAAAVFVNASTRFNDGFEFGFGAEIGISTQKLHARGPMGLAELVTYKYLVDGSGETRA